MEATATVPITTIRWGWERPGVGEKDFSMTPFDPHPGSSTCSRRAHHLRWLLSSHNPTTTPAMIAIFSSTTQRESSKRIGGITAILYPDSASQLVERGTNCPRRELHTAQALFDSKGRINQSVSYCGITYVWQVAPRAAGIEFLDPEN